MLAWLGVPPRNSITRSAAIQKADTWVALCRGTCLRAQLTCSISASERAWIGPLLVPVVGTLIIRGSACRKPSPASSIGLVMLASKARTHAFSLQSMVLA